MSDDPRRPEVTRLLHEWQDGDENALDALMPVIYDELHRLAQFAMKGEAPGHTLQTTALVNEAYVRLVGSDREWDGSRHFMRVAARAMRAVLVDHARKRKRQKRGGGAAVVDLQDVEGVVPGPGRPEALLDLDEALERLMALDERKGRAVELHYFGGLTYDEIAASLDISAATVHRELRMARAWLSKELASDSSSGPGALPSTE